MNRKTISLFSIVCLLVSAALFRGLAKTPPGRKTSMRTLQSLVDEAARTPLEKFTDKKLEEKQLSITLIDLRDPAPPQKESFRGNEQIYPASVVKLFYLA